MSALQRTEPSFGACPHCGTPLPARKPAAAVQLAAAPIKRRPGGKQLPLGPAVRTWAAYLQAAHGMSAIAAFRVADRVCSRALPKRQRKATR